MQPYTYIEIFIYKIVTQAYKLFIFSNAYYVAIWLNIAADLQWEFLSWECIKTYDY